MSDVAFDRVWYWRVRLPERKGEPCRVVARGTLHSILVEFVDGFRVVTSGFAVRRPERDPWPCLVCGALLLLAETGLVCPDCDAKVIPIDRAARRSLKRCFPHRVLHHQPPNRGWFTPKSTWT